MSAHSNDSGNANSAKIRQGCIGSPQVGAMQQPISMGLIRRIHRGLLFAAERSGSYDTEFAL